MGTIRLLFGILTIAGLLAFSGTNAAQEPTRPKPSKELSPSTVGQAKPLRWKRRRPTIRR